MSDAVVSPDGQQEWDGERWVPRRVAGIVSPDGQHEWDGSSWVPRQRPPVVPVKSDYVPIFSVPVPKDEPEVPVDGRRLGWALFGFLPWLALCFTGVGAGLIGGYLAYAVFYEKRDFGDCALGSMAFVGKCVAYIGGPLLAAALLAYNYGLLDN